MDELVKIMSLILMIYLTFDLIDPYGQIDLHDLIDLNGPHNL